MSRKAIVGIFAVCAFAAGAWWLLDNSRLRPPADGAIVLYGNVENREVSLAFNNSERIESVLVDEGDVVKAGQDLATLETGRLAPQLENAKALAEAARQTLARLLAGTRPEEIALARANLECARAAAVDARRRFERVQSLDGQSAVSIQDREAAEALAQQAAAREEAALKSHELAVAGPRAEDIAEARARLGAAQAQVALAEDMLADATLRSPVDAVVRTRVMEPGEMASPQKTVLTLSVTTPKWVRTYIDEARLGQVREGTPAVVTCDSFPNRVVQGRVGFVSSLAEFTPKTLQTEQLRTSLVYEVRILVDAPQNTLRLGMPVTVRIEQPAR